MLFQMTLSPSVFSLFILQRNVAIDCSMPQVVFFRATSNSGLLAGLGAWQYSFFCTSLEMQLLLGKGKKKMTEGFVDILTCLEFVGWMVTYG